MNKLMLGTVAASFALILGGCAMSPYQTGLIYTNVAAPMMVTNNSVGCPRKGTSSMYNILGLFSFGNASIAAAKNEANITTVGSVDVHYSNFLGLYGHTVTQVCGK